MKAKIIIENSETEIILTPDNVFDKDVLEKMYNNKGRYNIYTDVESDYKYGSYQNHRLVITIKEQRP